MRNYGSRQHVDNIEVSEDVSEDTNVVDEEVESDEIEDNVYDDNEDIEDTDDESNDTQEVSLIRKIIMFWPYFFMLGGLIGMGMPVITELWDAYRAQTDIVELNEVYNIMSDEDRLKVLNEAEAYNEALLFGDSYAQRLPYEQQLTWQDSNMIAYLEIPKLSVKLPVYHGTAEETLMTGVGHVETSALPVGTEGGRCVLAGHSGMQNSRMFDDIHLLEEGDTFVIWTLGEPYAYRVCDIRTVLPEEVENLIPEPGRDLVTLVTCTPYGVNTYRLLVTGERTEYVDISQMPDVQVYMNRRTLPLIAGSLFLLVLLVSAPIAAYRNKKRMEEEAKLLGLSLENKRKEPRHKRS